VKRVCATLLIAAATGCSGGGSGSKAAATPRKWGCNQGSASSCSCNGFRPQPGAFYAISGTAEPCTGFSCCILTESGDSESSATCECFDTTSSCAEEAATRRNASVVSQCPPVEEDTYTPACAAQGENCRPEYLATQGLHGCCSGTICKTTAGGIPICQTASTQEVALYGSCERAARWSTIGGTLTATPASVSTGVGVLQMDGAATVDPTFGTGGCLGEARITLHGASQCELDLTVSVSAGKLAVTHVFGMFDKCVGFTGPQFTTMLEDDPALIGFGVVFTGLTCSAGSSGFESCAAGTVDIHLLGTVDGIRLDDQHILFDGAFCGFVDSTAACPNP
jgi:hypothetical protein